MENRRRNRYRSLVSFRELLSRLTGFSTPIFGVSWEPPASEVLVAERLITFLEDKRVLYLGHGFTRHQNPGYGAESVLQIRQRLTQDLEELDRDSELAESLLAMRAACRTFLDRIEVKGDDGNVYALPDREDYEALAYYYVALGELRAVFGIHIARIAVRYGINVDKSLVSIFPANSSEELEGKDSVDGQ